MNTEMIAVAMGKRKLNDKNYREQHKEERSTYGREYYKKNKDRLCEIINCGCGGRFQYQGKAEHFKSKMHIEFINSITSNLNVETNIVKCICGGSHTNEYRHQLTKKHLTYLETVKEKQKEAEKEEPQREVRTVYSWERPYHQPGFRD